MSTQAHAYHLDAHRKITEKSIQPFGFDAGASSEIVRCCLKEDWNVITKWFRTSHYFNPVHPLPRTAPTWRGDSLDRVRRIVKVLAVASPEDQPCWIGHLIHHFQDMTVPAHVVAVSHGTSDRFEWYASQSTGLSRALERASRTPEEGVRTSSGVHELDSAQIEWLLKEVALETRAGVDGFLLAQQLGIEGEVLIPWSLFWKTEQAGWGRYGVFGNSFGMPEENDGSKKYAIDASVYDAFVERNVMRAITASKKILSLTQSFIH